MILQQRKKTVLDIIKGEHDLEHLCGHNPGGRLLFTRRDQVANTRRQVRRNVAAHSQPVEDEGYETEESSNHEAEQESREQNFGSAEEGSTEGGEIKQPGQLQTHAGTHFDGESKQLYATAVNATFPAAQAAHNQYGGQNMYGAYGMISGNGALPRSAFGLDTGHAAQYSMQPTEQHPYILAMANPMLHDVAATSPFNTPQQANRDGHYPFQPTPDTDIRTAPSMRSTFHGGILNNHITAPSQHSTINTIDYHNLAQYNRMRPSSSVPSLPLADFGHLPEMSQYNTQAVFQVRTRTSSDLPELSFILTFSTGRHDKLTMSMDRGTQPISRISQLRQSIHIHLHQMPQCQLLQA